MAYHADNGISCHRGVFIVIEGCDKIGKTTQCLKLVESLNEHGIPCEYMSFPDRHTEVGKIIDKYLKREIEVENEVIHLLFSANRWELKCVMKKKLLDGVSIVADRYSYSGLAYSAAKPEWCWNTEIGLLQPDVAVFFYVNGTVSLSREKYGLERYEVLDFQEKVKANFKRIKFLRSM
ncbi:hypothetical protein FOCC_FOCC000809, partial [Frankliniella occidentalis]